MRLGLPLTIATATIIYIYMWNYINNVIFHIYIYMYVQYFMKYTYYYILLGTCFFRTAPCPSENVSR